MAQIIDTLEKLQDVLRTYTGSSTVTYDVCNNFERDYVAMEYFTYSRGKNTLLFRNEPVENTLTLIEVYPKYKLSSWLQGFTEELLNKISVITPVSWKITSHWNTHLRIELSDILTESEVISILKLGFTAAYFSEDTTTTGFVMS
jgi:hypothetical protein